MPQRRAEDDLIPVADAWQRRIHHDPAGHAIGKLRRERIAYHVADIVRDKIGLLDLQLSRMRAMSVACVFLS